MTDTDALICSVCLWKGEHAPDCPHNEASIVRPSHPAAPSADEALVESFARWASEEGCAGDWRHAMTDAPITSLENAVQQMGDRVADMFEQMNKGNWIDDHGHDVRMNRAMMDLLGTMNAVMRFRTDAQSCNHRHRARRSQGEKPCNAQVTDQSFSPASIHIIARLGTGQFRSSATPYRATSDGFGTATSIGPTNGTTSIACRSVGG